MKSTPVKTKQVEVEVITISDSEDDEAFELPTADTQHVFQMLEQDEINVKEEKLTPPASPAGDNKTAAGEDSEPEAVDAVEADEPEADEPEADEPEADEPEEDEPEADELEADESDEAEADEGGEQEADEADAMQVDEAESDIPEAAEDEPGSSELEDEEADSYDSDQNDTESSSTPSRKSKKRKRNSQDNDPPYHPTGAQASFYQKIKRLKRKKRTRKETGSNNYGSGDTEEIVKDVEVNSKKQPNHRCPHCPTSFYEAGRLKSHLNAHSSTSNLKMFRCDKCTYTVKQKIYLVNHMQIHRQAQLEGSANNIYPPRSKFRSKHRTKEQMKRGVMAKKKDQSNYKYQCKECDYATNSKAWFNRHVVKHGQAIRTTAKSKTAAVKKASSKWLKAAKGFSCSKCPAWYTGKRDVENHFRMHGTKKAHTCDVCDYSTNIRRILKIHRKLHDIPRTCTNLQCTECGKVRFNAEEIGGHCFCNFCGSPLNQLAQLGDESSEKTKEATPSPSKTQAGPSRSASASPNLRLHRLEESGSQPVKSISAEKFEQVSKGNPNFKYRDLSDLDREPGGQNLKIVNLYSLQQMPRATTSTEDEIEKEDSAQTNPADATEESAVRSNASLSAHNLQKPKPVQVEVETADSSLPGNSANLELDSDNPSSVSLSTSSATALGTPSPNSSEQPANDEQFVTENIFTENVGNIESDMREEEEGRGSYLIKRIKVDNFMCIDQMDEDVGQLIGFPASTVGKSAHVIAVLLGLGYDLLVDLPSTSNSLCGWQLKDLICHGKDTANIELTISLDSSKQLQKEYGSELTLIRSFYRGISLASTPLEIRYKSAVIQNTVPILKPRLRVIMELLKINQAYYRLMVLDENNMKMFMNKPDNWHYIYLQTVNLKKDKLRAEIKVLDFKLARAQEDNVWRQAKLEFLKTELATEYPMDHPLFEKNRKDDLESYIKFTKKLSKLKAEFKKLNGEIAIAYTELQHVSNSVLERMQKRFQEFLLLHDHFGNIVVDHASSELGIWAQSRSASSSITSLTTTKEAMEKWNLLSPGNKLMTMLGLYLAFWEVVDTCPILAVDAFSSTELGFKFSKSGLPALMDLIQKAPAKGQQVVASLEELPNPPFI